MQNNLEINISYSAWKEKYVKYLEKNNSGRHGFQNNFYANLLIENFEKTFPGHLSIKVNEQFTALVNKYSYELRAAYGFEWDKSKVEAAIILSFWNLWMNLNKMDFYLNPK